MSFATFLPATSVAHIKTVIGEVSVLSAHSWRELESFLQTRYVSSVLIDPSAGGFGQGSPAIDLISKHRSIPFLAYTPMTFEGLHAVAKLSKFGLADAIVHPASGKTIVTAVERVVISSHAQSFLGNFEASFHRLPEDVVVALLDLYRRPHRYQSGKDLARQAGITPKRLETNFRSANLGPANRFVILAKLLRAFGYLREDQARVASACKMVGYSHRSVFAAHTRAAFGCTPSQLGAYMSEEELLMSAVEWLCKPQFRLHSRRTI